MTTATDYPPAPRRFNRAAEWLGHRASGLYLVGCIAAGPMALLRPSAVTIACGEVTILTLVSLFLLGLKHRRRLCEPCIASMPLDGQAQAHAKRRLLRFSHWIADSTPIRVLNVYVGTVRWLLLMLPIFAEGFVLPRYGWVRMAGDMVVVSPMLWLLHCHNVHFRLQAWCPQCHWGNGGDGIPEPSPDPAIPQPV